MIQENSHDPRKLFNSAQTIFNHEAALNFQGYQDDRVQKADDIGNFFIQKVEVIRSKLDSATSSVDASYPARSVSPACFDVFNPPTKDDVTKLIANSNRKSCCHDPMLASPGYKCLDVLLPVLSRMINMSLQSGCFPDSWKHAVVQPKLKKRNAGTPFQISVLYLTLVSTLVERAVFNQIHDLFTFHNLYPKAQSSYR